MTTREISILVIEDEPEIRKFLKAALTDHGYNPVFAENGREGIKLINSHPPDAVFLDLGLPDMDGLDVIKNIREWSTIPIIVLSARGKEPDKVTALELGADDYLTKPFGIPELLARLKVALRRVWQAQSLNTPLFTAGEISVDLEKRLVKVKDEEIHLTPTEYKVLTTLVKYADKVVTQQQLVKEIWGKSLSENGHYLRIYIQHLRQKLKDDPMHPKYIITEAGIGYRFKSQ